MQISKRRTTTRRNYLKRTIFNTVAGAMFVIGLVILIGSAGKSDSQGVTYPLSQLIRESVTGIVLMGGSLIVRWG